MEKQDFDFIQARIGYNFSNPDLLQQAFVRKTYAMENGGEHNEVLEFIGDKVLELVVLKKLINRFGFYTSDCDDYSPEDWNEFCCGKDEGELTNLKVKLVQKKTLSNCIDRLELSDYLIMGKSDQKNNVNESKSVKEDLFEAILGAVALDSNWDFKDLESVVELMLNPDAYISEGEEENYVELIQEWSLRNYGCLPDYSFEESFRFQEEIVSILSNEIRAVPTYRREQFPSKRYRCNLLLQDVDKKFVGYGYSQGEAHKTACEVAYKYLEENDMLFTIRDEIENPNKYEAINQLETLARRGYFPLPEYEYEQSYDSNGNPVWVCICSIDGCDRFSKSKSSSKKDAKKSAAFKMLKYVLS